MTPAALKAILFDARDTLGEVDRPGHLVPYRPSTEKLLTAAKNVLKLAIGVITNLPDNVSAEQGRAMITGAVLSEDGPAGKPLTIGDFISADAIVTNKDGHGEKPDPSIYLYAADRLGVPPAQCLFVGENLVENLGARAAGMQTMLKPCPPGREFSPAVPPHGIPSPTDSGRAFEAFFEHEHLLGERIFACGEKIAEALGALTEGKAPPLDQGRWVSPPPIAIPPNLRTALGFFVHLIDHFADQVHLRAEESMAEVAIARGMDPHRAQWMFDQHAQARAYWQGLDVAWRRIQFGDDDDRFFAVEDFRHGVAGFIELFKAHAVRENNQLYPEAGSYFGDTDDTMVLNLISHFGPPDITPFVGMVEAMEAALGIHS